MWKSNLKNKRQWGGNTAFQDCSLYVQWNTNIPAICTGNNWTCTTPGHTCDMKTSLLSSMMLKIMETWNLQTEKNSLAQNSLSVKKWPLPPDSLILLTRWLRSSQFTWKPSKAWLLAFLSNCLMTTSSTRCRKSFRPGGSGSLGSVWKCCSVPWSKDSVWVQLFVVDTVWISVSAVCTVLVWQPLWNTSKWKPFSDEYTIWELHRCRHRFEMSEMGVKYWR